MKLTINKKHVASLIIAILIALIFTPTTTVYAVGGNNPENTVEPDQSSTNIDNTNQVTTPQPTSQPQDNETPVVHLTCEDQGLVWDDAAQACVANDIQTPIIQDTNVTNEVANQETIIDQVDNENLTIVKYTVETPTANASEAGEKPNYGYKNGTWALSNFLFTFAGFLIAMSAFLFKSHRERIDQYNLNVKYYERKKSYMYCNLFISLCGIAIFSLTEHITDMMVLFDEFSTMSFIFMVINIAINIIYCRWYDASSIYE